MEKDALSFKERTFIHRLTPLEVIYLQNQKLLTVVTAVVNSLVSKGVIFIHPDFKMEVEKLDRVETIEHLQVVTELTHLQKAFYSTLSTRLMSKAIFTRIERSMDAFKKYYIKSKKFGTLFYANFIALALLLMLALIRLITGLAHHKPIDNILITSFILTALIVFFLYYVTRLMCTHAIPEMYRDRLEKSPTERTDLNWQYFLVGSTALAPAFVPLVTHVEQKSGDASGFFLRLILWKLLQ